MTISMNKQVQVSVEDLLDTLNSAQEDNVKASTGIASRPAKETDNDGGVLSFFRDMFSNSQAKAAEAREDIQSEMYRLAQESAYEAAEARKLAGITRSLTEGGGEIGRKPLPEGTTLRPVARPSMTSLRDVTDTDEGKLDNEQIPSTQLEPTAKDEADEVVNSLVEQLTNARITAGKDVEEAVPVTAETSYKVTSGDTLSKIAKANDTTVAAILTANPDIKNPNTISVGQDIALPSAEPVEEAAPVATQGAGLMSRRLDSKGETPNSSPIPEIKFIGNKGTTQGDVERSVYEYAYEQGLRDDELKSFMSQVAHESTTFSRKEELKYTKSNVNSMDKSRFSVGDTYKGKELEAGDPMVGQFKNIDRRRFVRDGVTDAQGNLQNYSADNVFNSRYASRMGNGDFASGDGSRYRGRGYIQLTGRNNYRAVGEAMGLDLEGNPDLMLDPDIAKKASVAWWKLNVQPENPDYTDVRRITRIVNGGSNGLADRRKKFNAYGEPVTAVSKSVRPKQRPEKTEE